MVEITYTIIISGTVQETSVQGMSEEKSKTHQVLMNQNFAFAYTSSLSPRAITRLKPAIQSKTQYLVSD